MGRAPVLFISGNSQTSNKLLDFSRRLRMKYYRLLFASVIVSISIVSFTKVMAQKDIPILQPPVTEKKPKITEINGDRLVDNYFWLREKNNPAVIAYLETENAYKAAMMKTNETLEDKIYNENFSHISTTYEKGSYLLG